MGRLIDADKLLNKLWHMSYYDPDDGVKVAQIVNNAPTIEALPKADYEARLKADMVAMLTDIQLECEENTTRWYCGRVDGKSDDVILLETLQEIIQEKINALKE